MRREALRVTGRRQAHREAAGGTQDRQQFQHAVAGIGCVTGFLVKHGVTVGGLGELLGGTLIGAFFIGGAETIIALASSQAFAQTIVFALAIVVLRFRPQGVLGER